MLVPETFKLPADPDQDVQVRLQLAAAVSVERQFELHRQVHAAGSARIPRGDFGYDHRGYSGKPFTRIVGAIPMGKLHVLLRDLRTQPAAWFEPLIPRNELPAPLRSMNPIIVTEVFPDTELLREQSPAAGPQSVLYLEKLSDELWSLVQDQNKQFNTVRFQMIFVRQAVAEQR